jgi:DNA-binding transcriptional MocR family regulator
MAGSFAPGAIPEKIHFPADLWYQSRMLWLRLDGDGPLHRQAYRALRSAILERRLAPGAKLPATRALARELGLSRNTVLAAYEQLEAEGYVAARTGSGPRVCEPRRGRAPRADAARRRLREPPQLSAFGARLAAGIPHTQASWSLPREPLPYDFRYGEPAYADLPLATWSRLLGRRARRLSVRRLAYQPPGGAPELREALAGYLARARGVRAAPEQVLVVHGTQQAIDPPPACSWTRATRWCSRSRTTPASPSASPRSARRPRSCPSTRTGSGWTCSSRCAPHGSPA